MAELDSRGRFPFGRPSGRCEPRPAHGPSSAIVLGVYPSALHVKWTPRSGTGVAALAVDEEPWPFWDGADQDERVDRWRAEVGWQDSWGTAESVGRLNGSSGRVVLDHVLQPLGLQHEHVWLTDVLPFFFVHRGEGTQGAAMTDHYDLFAAEHGLEPHDLPSRPSPAELVRRAVSEEGDRLRSEIVASQADLVVTLGNEALAVAAQLVQGDLPTALTREPYGQRHQAGLGDLALQVLPLVHPGQRAQAWTSAHRGWVDQQGGTST